MQGGFSGGDLSQVAAVTFGLPGPLFARPRRLAGQRLVELTVLTEMNQAGRTTGRTTPTPAL